MKSAVNLLLIVFMVFCLGLLNSGCICEVRVRHGYFPNDGLVPSGDSLRLAEDANDVLLRLARESLKVVAGPLRGRCAKPLRIEFREQGIDGKWAGWGEPLLMKQEKQIDSSGLEHGSASASYAFIFTAADVNSTFQYKIHNVGRGGGPFEIAALREAYFQGREYGARHSRGQLRTYRLLIVLVERYPASSGTCELDRSEFFRGFREAYEEADGNASAANKVEDLLRKTLLVAGIYDDGREQGVAYIEGKVTNSEIANMIRRYLKPTEHELAYKAGYVEGYVQTHSRADKESLYKDAEWMYLSLRLPDRP